MSHDVVVTGIGLVTALGADRETTWASILAGRRGFAPLRLFDLPGREAPVVAEVGSFPRKKGVPKRALRASSRTDRMTIAAALEAVADAGLSSLAGAACVLGASSAGMLEGEEYFRHAFEEGHDHARRELLGGIEAASTASRVALALGATGPRATFTTACSSSAHALGHALDLVRSGEVEVALAGGGDGLCRLAAAGFLALENVSRAGCRPFDKDRDGMTLGEAAAVLVLERAGRARRPYARLLGYGSACEAFHATATDPTGRGAEDAIRAALTDAALDSRAVGYVNAHAPGTRDNDGAESAALARVFAHGPAVSSTKALHGHTLGAAGALEAAVTCLALREGWLPGQGKTHAEGAIDVVEAARDKRVEHAVSLSLAFGGNDVALVFGAAP
ncbi:MAG TPA: beta-ketoacyl-[acyl-carrier-protein] synthase family protein [Planctomycetota bacterium]|nr:beta-ketoacyl-[acyl-carrier-protein] synthase family protein [Planctomycetota bacterium]